MVMQPEAIKVWASDMRAGSNGGFQLNLWIPDPTPKRNLAAEDAVRDFLRAWGPEVASEAGNFTLPDFAAQCEALLEAGPPIISSIIGALSGSLRDANESERHQVVCNSNGVTEAKEAEDAGADVIIAKEWRRADIAARLMPRRQKGAWSAFSVYCPPLWMP